MFLIGLGPMPISGRVMPQATFRSGVAGYTPFAPTGFQFGVPQFTYNQRTFTPGTFDPGVIGPDGTWTPTPNVAPGTNAPIITPIDFNLTPSGAEKE